MPQYIAFLRAINLGAKRKFPSADIVAATEAAGMTDVATHINTGNVRFTASLRSTSRVRAALERAYAADRGFPVPTFVFTPDEVQAIARRTEELQGTHGSARPYVQLLHEPPPQAAVDAAQALDFPGEALIVEGRVAYVLLESVQGAKTINSKAYAVLGEGTSRTDTVLQAIAAKWC